MCSGGKERDGARHDECVCLAVCPTGGQLAPAGKAGKAAAAVI